MENEEIDYEKHSEEQIAAAQVNAENRIDYNNIGWVSGIFQSFTDAPGGFSEELKELTYSVGTEYMYQDSFAFRLGYFYENPDKGARTFFSIGAGFAYNIMKLDVSYLFSTSNVANPLENTLRFSLSFALGEKYEEYQKLNNYKYINPNFKVLKFGFFFSNNNERNKY